MAFDSFLNLRRNSSFAKNSSFKIPTKSDYESIISELGSNAYSYFSQVNGLNMKEGLYYLTNTKGSGGSYYKYFLVLKGNSLTFEDKHPFDVTGRVRCMLSFTHFKIILF